MAGLPWVKVSVDFASHPKAAALERRLGDPRAVLHLPAVWGYFARHHPDGAMPDTEDAIHALEKAALWGGEAGTLVTALAEVHVLERRRGRLVAHGWEEWQKPHAEKLDRDRARARAKRAEEREKRHATVAPESRDGRAVEREGEGEEADPSSLREEVTPSASAAAPASPVVASLPCVGTGPKQFDVTEAQLARWQEAFPGADVLAEVRKALAWLEAKPARRKTHRGCPAFLVRWLGRAQDQGQRGPPAGADERRRVGVVATAEELQPAAPAAALPGGWADLAAQLPADAFSGMCRTVLATCELWVEGRGLVARPPGTDVAAALETYRPGLERQAAALGYELRILEQPRAAAGGAP